MNIKILLSIKTENTIGNKHTKNYFVSKYEIIR